VALIIDMAPEAHGHLRITDQQLVGPLAVDERRLVQLIGPVHWIQPAEAVRKTLAIFRVAGFSVLRPPV
jgi:hypothetical protein